MTALVMFLPHIPSDLASHLPALFNIYSRMLFWDRERRATTESAVTDEDDDKEETTPPEDKDSWSKLSYLLESDDETVPELLHYFTFLYGLYPLNFMSYIRKPQKYLRHANFPGADDLDVQPTEIRQRSEPFRQVHLLHPNFYEMTIESELTDNNRWMRSEAADVVAECMALYSPGEEGHLLPARSRGSNAWKKADLNADVPEQPLLECETPFQSRHTSWRNTSSTIVASPDGYKNSGLHRKASQTSHSMPSIADSPSLRPVGDSPTLPPHLINSVSHPQLQDMLNSQRSTRGSMYRTLTNDSVASLAPSQNHQDNSAHVDAYLQSLAKEPALRSPSLRSSTNDPGVKVAYLHREIQLLRNDLNFERYLKQQHLSHIGHLRRKQIREARVEAETQNLLNSNRSLKSKLEEAKRLNAQMKKEGEKSKSHSRKWETDLASKLRVLRDEQKKWALEKEELNRELGILRDDAFQLRQLVVASEAKDLASQQKVQSVEANLDELERLRVEVDKLTLALRTYEAGETEAVQAREREEDALKQVEILTLKLRARDEELNKHKAAFEAELQVLRTQPEAVINDNDRKKNQELSQDMIDSALAVSRNRIVEAQKAHNHLLKRYNGLYSAYLELKEAYEHGEKDNNDSLLGGGSARPYFQTSQTFRARSPTPMIGDGIRRNHTFSETGSDSHHGLDGPSNLADRPGRLDTSFTPTGPDSRSPVGGNGGLFRSPFGSSSGRGTDRGSVDSESPSLDGQGNPKPKIKPQSDIRIYGRGKPLSSVQLCGNDETFQTVLTIVE
jgi:solute carrier family 25 protein 16